jgi:ferrochelatase
MLGNWWILSEHAEKPKIAIILFNLGGPDSKQAIKPFLLNLFRDPAILRVPFFVGPLLARFIASKRLAPATENYALLGNKSPLLELTEQQARALELALPEWNVRCFVAMRYWHPMSDAVVRQVRDFAPDRIILLPLYPHYSTTTTGSSLTAWRVAAAKAGLVAPVTTLCCYPDDDAYIDATAQLLKQSLETSVAAMPAGQKLRVLFSAHGLPETIIKKGDPYQAQIERSVAAIIARCPEIAAHEWSICYQSRATPQVWIGPSTDEEIEKAGHDKVALLVQPVAFVSEHSETLVELDIEYRDLALKNGVPFYFRVPAQNDFPPFIAALAGLARTSYGRGVGLCSHQGGGTCPAQHGACPHNRIAG